ncbi:uncharacterized protein LOC100120629 isoform X3 [Nasonia vitripennis]|uniref:Neurotrypsin n=1 Tax=Nasonia vitripennis TaxID=7425 RepID=A0A7M7IQP4_NASVI|nr:uncharacterized protein LOC100120629 isoform X3 [Nasonia vitripennis]
MAAKSRELFLAALLLLLLSTCALVHCLDADKIEAPKSLPEAEKDFPAEHLIEAENDEERKLGKRVVNWSAWQKQKEQLNRSPYQQSASQQGSLAQYTNGGHGYEFHRQNPSIPVGNPDVKWTSLHHGHNEFSQGYDDKEDDEWYEGISSESTKPRKEKLPKSPADHSDMVAKYDVARGVQCPSADATGIFVYPPDCKFYVTCWNGRAFVQPCAPGTLFSPDSLECDFPDKVKCYGGEIADFPGVDVDHLDESAGVREPLLNGGHSARYEAQGQLEPSCPPNMNGLLDHPSDCAKFLQCANGQTYVMSCGPGSVFNPMTTVCDHPRNVPGCEDAAAVDDDGEYSGTQQPPIDHDYAGSSSLHTSVKPTSHGSVRTAKKVECPAEFSGLLPHPETCAKFLQCANGATYVMDCGPGTVFNPLTTVCDWPYNVPGCGAKKNPAQQSANNSPSYEQPGLSTYPSHTTHNQNWNAQGHNQQGISGVTVNHQGSATTNQGYGHQGSVNSQGYGHQGHYGGSSTTQGHQGQHGGSVGHHGQFAGQGNTQGYGHQGHFAGSSTNQQGYVESGSQHGYNHQSNYGTSSSNQWHREGTDQSYYDSQYQGSSLNPASQHHDHHGHHSGSGDSNFGHQVPHHGQYQTTTYPYKLDVRGSYPDPNLQHPTQPSHPINGHAYPYNPQGSNKNQPKPAKSQPSDPESSSEEEHPGQNQGQAWAVPGGSPRPGAQTEKPWVMRIPNDRRNYSRTHDRWPTNSGTGNKWSTSESSQPKPGGTLQPSTWRGMGPGFENRPSIPGRGHPVISEEEPPFPAAYAPPQVKSSSLISGSHKPGVLTPLSGQAIRLRGGPDPSEGFVEVQGNRPGWGVVCDTPDGWTLKEAHVVCKQLGYRRGAAMAYQGRSRTTLVPKWIAANSVTCQGNETKFQNCKFTHKPECRVAKDAIAVRCLPHRVAHCRKDELAHDGQCYHFAEATQALNHAEAHDYCQRRGSRLIDVVDQAEHDFISEMLMQSQPHVDSVMTAGMGFTTLNKTIWMWEDSSVAKFKFSKWWPGWEGDRKTAPFAGTRPVCIILTRKFPCHDRQENHCKTDHFFWDVEDCASSNKGRAFICERAFEEIGCVYGNGNQYFGNASVAASGRDCLSWSDPQVSRSLMNKITSKEAREKLQSHNFCRNPNPNKESRPWCFTGPRGEYEYCDIPYCGKILSKKAHLTGSCKPKHFECSPGECIPSPWVCDGQEDCTNGADERKCSSHINFFKKYAKHRLDGYEVEKWLNTPAKTCALRCKEADFTCRSFTHQADGNVCYLSDSNIGMTGALVSSGEHDYYEMRDHTLDCEDMFVCANQKCINQTKVCDGKNDCLDRSDEKICTAENLDYGIRLGGANSSHEGRIEVKIFGKWGQVCDDGFDMIDANVVCRELGFSLGALEVRPGGFYGNLNPPDLFIVDQLKCRGNESSIRECDFEGWGKHNCEPEEAVGVVCKTDVDTCQEGHWKCDNSPMCIPTPFICDEVSDCPDGSDESSAHCDAPFELRLANGSSPMQGRVEIRHHGIWGTVCDDDFSNATAKVICRSLGYGGPAMVKKDGYFGPGTGPIWLDEVFCFGNETQLYKCEHDHWGRHNCDHAEDAGVICSAGPVPAEYESGSGGAEDREARIATELNIDDLLPTECGKRLEDFAEDDELIFERVVRSSVAPRGSYPWQASIRVRGHSKSSHWCGAVVLSPLHVLTAAHCLEGYNKGTYFVRAGDYNTEVDEGTEAEANIEDYYIHEDFRKGHRLNNDIAVVLLKGRGIPLGRNVMPICLPYENIEYPAGLNCTISGFGSVEAGSSTHSRKLRFGWVPLLDQSVCKADYVYGQSSITDGMICAGHLDGGPDTCDGDSGGPLACQHNGAFTLYGLTSWGQHCGRVNKPGVYVRIAHYRKWIDQKIRESLIGR